MGQPKLGLMIRGARKRQGKTLREVAEGTDVSISYVSQVESKNMQASKKFVLAVSKFLGLDTDVTLLLINELPSDIEKFLRKPGAILAIRKIIQTKGG